MYVNNSMKTFDPARAQNNQMADESVTKQIEAQNKLFTAYLKNQTPDDKADTQQMMQSILSMMQATQHMQTNKYLKDSLSSQKEQFNLSLGQYLGRTVEHKTNSINFTGHPSEIKVKAPQNVSAITMRILTQDGQVVDEAELDPTLPVHDLKWSGVNPETGTSYPEGLYKISVLCESKTRDPITGKHTLKNAEVFVKNFVDSVSFDDNQNPVLYSGQLSLRPNDILNIQKPVRAKPYYNVFDTARDVMGGGNQTSGESHGGTHDRPSHGYSHSGPRDGSNNAPPPRSHGAASGGSSTRPVLTSVNDIGSVSITPHELSA